MNQSLTKGQNAQLGSASVDLIVSSSSVPIDVSALLLGADQKVRDDRDLVFYNNPSHDGVTSSGNKISVDLGRVPQSVAGVVIVASVDGGQNGLVFTKAPTLTVSQPDGPRLSFSAPDFSSRETVVTVAEVYRKNGSWKVRAIGQGYSSGLAGLATDYGVDIDDEPTSDTAQGSSVHNEKPSTNTPKVGLTKLGSQAPALLKSAQSADAIISRSGAGNRRAAVYLVLDHSIESEELYESFAIQAFAERVLALSAVVDDDGNVPIIFTGSRNPFVEEFSLVLQP